MGGKWIITIFISGWSFPLIYEDVVEHTVTIKYSVSTATHLAHIILFL